MPRKLSIPPAARRGLMPLALCALAALVPPAAQAAGGTSTGQTTAGQDGKTPCKASLAIGLNVDTGVGQDEWLSQTRGLSQALKAPEVQKAILADPAARVDLYVFAWGGPELQTVLLPWTRVLTGNDLAGVIKLLDAPAKPDALHNGALGMALLHGENALQSEAECGARVLILLSDGDASTSFGPAGLGSTSAAAGITVDAVVVGGPAQSETEGGGSTPMNTAQRFRDNVIRGPGAVVETVPDFTRIQPALEKLLLDVLGAGPGNAAGTGSRDGTRIIPGGAGSTAPDSTPQVTPAPPAGN